MNKITLLAHAVLKDIDHLDDDEWEIAANCVHKVLDRLFEHGYTSENLSGLLTEEYTRWNKQGDDEMMKEFFG
jgi:hypothetical protein